MALKFPRSIRILGELIHIKVVKELKVAHITGDERGEDDSPQDKLHGYYSAEKNTIYICKDLSSEKQMMVLLHECLHAILEISQMNHIVPNSEQEEALIRVQETGLKQILKQIGPQIVAAVCDEYDKGIEDTSSV